MTAYSGACPSESVLRSQRKVGRHFAFKRTWVQIALPLYRMEDEQGKPPTNISH